MSDIHKLSGTAAGEWVYSVKIMNDSGDTKDKNSMGTIQHFFYLNTLRPRQNGRHFPDDIFKWIFLNENV